MNSYAIAGERLLQALDENESLKGGIAKLEGKNAIVGISTMVRMTKKLLLYL